MIIVYTQSLFCLIFQMFVFICFKIKEQSSYDKNILSETAKVNRDPLKHSDVLFLKGEGYVITTGKVLMELKHNLEILECPQLPFF